METMTRSIQELPQRFEARALSSLELYSGAYPGLQISVEDALLKLLQCTLTDSAICKLGFTDHSIVDVESLEELGICALGTWEHLFIHGPLHYSHQEGLFAPGSSVLVPDFGLHFPAVLGNKFLLIKEGDISRMKAVVVLEA